MSIALTQTHAVSCKPVKLAQALKALRTFRGQSDLFSRFRNNLTHDQNHRRVLLKHRDLLRFLRHVEFDPKVDFEDLRKIVRIEIENKMNDLNSVLQDMKKNFWDRDTPVPSEITNRALETLARLEAAEFVGQNSFHRDDSLYNTVELLVHDLTPSLWNLAMNHGRAPQLLNEATDIWSRYQTKFRPKHRDLPGPRADRQDLDALKRELETFLSKYI